MNMSGCRGIGNEVSDKESIIILIMFVVLYADDTIVPSDDPEECQDILTAFHAYCKLLKSALH